MKGKGVVTAEDSDEKGDSSSLPPGRLSTRNASSKYDFVKVKVWLGDNADHYYVLSRFLLSRMLTVTKIPNHVAIKIALELKKLLIDNSLLDVSQSDLEANLFKVQLSLIRFLLLAFDQDRNLFSCPGRHGFDVYINMIDRIFSIHSKLMERRGYGEEYINRYKMMTRFHHQRVPLVILVCGTACSGKSTIATQLAQRLNLPNVLQTDMVYELLRTSTDAPLASTPVWAREFNSPEELITEFCRECRIVRKGLAGDLKKAMKDGKPIIIEGIHLDPSIYLVDEGNRVLTDLPKTSGNTAAVSEPSEDNTATLAKHTENEKCAPEKVGAKEGTSADQVAEVTENLGSVDLAKNASDYQGRPLNDPDMKSSKSMKNQKIAAEPIIVPMVLKMAEFDHKALLEEWISKRTFWDKCLDQDQDKLISNIKTIQDYLCSFESQGLTVISNSATTFPQTLDGLHSYLLQCIERGISTKSSETGRQSGGKD